MESIEKSIKYREVVMSIEKLTECIVKGACLAEQDEKSVSLTGEYLGLVISLLELRP